MKSETIHDHAFRDTYLATDKSVNDRVWNITHKAVGKRIYRQLDSSIWDVVLDVMCTTIEEAVDDALLDYDYKLMRRH